MITALLTRLTAPWVWRKEARAARLLTSFQRAEASSMLDLLAAARQTQSPERRALYLRHALDEERHARTFAARARQLGLVDSHDADFDALFDRLGEVGFLAYVHRGERRGRAQFAEHRRALHLCGDDKGAALFDAILVDEERHESYTGTLLSELVGQRGARSALRKAALREALWRWRRMGRAIAGLLFAISASLLFVLLLPFAIADRVMHRSERGWRT